MSYPLFYIYEESVSRRSTEFLFMFLVMVILLGGGYLLGRWRPSWRPALFWVFGVGGFYATLVPMVVYYFVGPQAP